MYHFNLWFYLFVIFS